MKRTFCFMCDEKTMNDATDNQNSFAEPKPFAEPKAFAEPKPIVPLLDYQRRDVESEDRFRWCCWSRQTGKSFAKSLRRILRGLKRGRTQVFLSAGERQSRELMTKARQHLETLKIAHEFIGDGFFADTSFRQLEIVLPNGVRIIGLPANPMTARGFTGDVFLDEFAMHIDDRDIWAAMFPVLVRGQGELDVASTPNGKANMFYTLRNTPRFTRSTVTIYDAIDQGLDVDVDALRASLADELLFRQEFLCEFVDEATALLPYDLIRTCEDPQLDVEIDWDWLRETDAPLFLGVDIGRKHDLTVMWLLEKKGTQLFSAGIIEMQNARFRHQAAILAELLEVRAVRRCCIDAGGIGMQLAEDAAERFGSTRIVQTTLTNAVKASLAGRLKALVEEGRIRIPSDTAIRNDWHAIERSLTAAGQLRLDAKRTAAGHADRFWAAALAVAAADKDAGKPEYLSAGKMRFAVARPSPHEDLLTAASASGAEIR